MTAEASLYPDILFHFTQKSAFFDILESTFKISYTKEKIIGPSSSRAFGVPMVSFCDLKLSELKVHMTRYGKYGIGLTKDWANRQGLSPVMYINRHSDFTDAFISAIDGIYKYLRSERDGDTYEKLNNDYMNLLNTYRYLKNYEGELIRSNVVVKPNFRFADEREWRFVPSISQSAMYPLVPITTIDTKSKKQDANHRLEHIRLKFEPNDIKYLIIENDSEIPELIEHLRVVKDKFDKQTIDKLLCRILTSEQINNDM